MLTSVSPLEYRYNLQSQSGSKRRAYFISSLTQISLVLYFTSNFPPLADFFMLLFLLMNSFHSNARHAV